MLDQYFIRKSKEVNRFFGQFALLFEWHLKPQKGPLKKTIKVEGKPAPVKRAKRRVAGACCERHKAQSAEPQQVPVARRVRMKTLHAPTHKQKPKHHLKKTKPQKHAPQTTP
jgi:hypothetical protein